MKTLASKTGFWSSLIAALSLLIFTVCFVLIAATREVSAWTTLEDYLASVEKSGQGLKYLAQFCALIFGMSYLVILHAIHESAQPENRIFSRIGLSFGALFAAFIGVNYFLQLTFVRFNIENGNGSILEQWIMFNPNAVILSIAMLGWTLCLGLSSLFIAPVFKGRGLAKAIRILFLLNGLFCLSGGVGFVFQITPLVNFAMNFAMGGVMTALAIILSIYFCKINGFSKKE